MVRGPLGQVVPSPVKNTERFSACCTVSHAQWNQKKADLLPIYGCTFLVHLPYRLFSPDD